MKYVNNIKYFNNIVISESAFCVKCGDLIVWRDNREEDEEFRSVVDKLKNHMIKDTKCLREQKLKTLFGKNKSKT